MKLERFLEDNVNVTYSKHVKFKGWVPNFGTKSKYRGGQTIVISKWVKTATSSQILGIINIFQEIDSHIDFKLEWLKLSRFISCALVGHTIKT